MESIVNTPSVIAAVDILMYVGYKGTQLATVIFAVAVCTCNSKVRLR